MKVYDLYLSVGSGCRPARHLARHGLRHEAFPLDWQMSYSLDTAIHLLKTGYEDFFVDIESDPLKSEKGHHRWVMDKVNHIVSIHHFSKDVSLEEGQEEFLEKMRIRAKKMHERILETSHVVLSGSRRDSIEELRRFMESFSEIYPHLHITMLNVRDMEGWEKGEFEREEYCFSDKLFLEEYRFNERIDHKTGEKFDWMGNTEMWDRVLEPYVSPESIKRMNDFKESHKVLVVYGAGKGCREVIRMLGKYRINVSEIAVSQKEGNPETIDQLPVKCIDEIEKNSFIILSIQNKEEQRKIEGLLQEKGFLQYGVYTNGRIMEKV